MPRVADPAVRQALIETAARILATDGPARLTLRHLAGTVGTSTMAIYTHFGGMDQLRIAVCAEGFRRLAVHLASVTETDDPVADLFSLGAAYATNARQNPHLYRAMFLDRPALAAPVDVRMGPTGDRDVVRSRPNRDPGSSEDDPISDLRIYGVATFELLVDATRRCVEAGRFDIGSDPRTLAAELWGATHGLVALELAGSLRVSETPGLLESIGRHLAVAFGDSPDTVATSAAAARVGARS